jgi:galactokinase/mevalonate kinase-like predicted kinase
MASGRAFARAALAGNPSDGYGGAVLAVCVPALAAHAEATPAAQATSDPPSALVDAAVARFARGACAVRWRTAVPREVGLAGSSAIVTATVRALCALHGHELAPDDLAEMVLAVEVDDLGIAAGPQDRYAQAHEGLVLMDFGGERPRVERLDVALLPPLYLAWRTDAAQTSHAVHGGLRERAGEAALRAAMARLADHARAARDALHAGDPGALAAAIDASYDERAALMDLDPRHVAMVHAARGAGASANYAGSGGAIVGTLPPSGAPPLQTVLESLGCEVIAPMWVATSGRLP